MNISPDERQALDADFVQETRGPRFSAAISRVYAEVIVGFLLGFSTCALVVALFFYVWLVRDA